MVKNLLISAFLTLLSACGTLDNKTILLNTGDSKERVLEVMGKPQDRQISGSNEAWQYCVSGASFGSNDHKIVWLQSGLVTAISTYKSHADGCTANMKQINWQSKPDSVIEIRNR